MDELEWWTNGPIARRHQMVEARKDRARARLEKDEIEGLFLGIVGLARAPREFDFGNEIILREVEEAPTLLDLSGAVKYPQLSGSVSRYTPRITHELCIQSMSDEDRNERFELGYATFSLLRIRTGAQLLAPFVSDKAWSTIAAFERGEVLILPIEEYPHALSLGETGYDVRMIDMEWVASNIAIFQALKRNANFSLAVQALDTYSHQATRRMGVATLWSGIEALLGISHELRFRISIYVASLLKPRGPERIDYYAKMKRAYDLRSRAVHGAEISDDDLVDHIGQIRDVLASLITYSINQGRIIDQELLDQLVFS